MSDDPTQPEPKQADDPTGSDVARPAPLSPELRFHRKRHQLVQAHFQDHGAVSEDQYGAMTRTARGHAGGMSRGRTAGEEESLPFSEDGAIDIADLCSDNTGTTRLFNALHAYAEPPEWIPYLPKPGTYTHPTYGKIAMTAERATRFMDNFKAGVYQKSIPIDAEHQTKLSGAVGHIEDMRRNADGSVDAKATWTDRGVKLLASDRYRYFSPEWFDKWTDPHDETVHPDIAIGGAITTRPFFKEKALRPLIASEDGTVYVADVTPGDEVTEIYFEALAPVVDRQGARARMEDTEKKAAAPEREGSARMDEHEQKTPEPKQTAEPAGESRKFAEMERKFAEMESKLATERAAREASEAKVNAMTAMAQRRRFTDLVLGRAEGADGARWVGEVEKNVDKLIQVADKFGEDSEFYRDYVSDQTARASVDKTSALFAEIGTSRTGDAGSKRASEVAAIRLAEPKLTDAAAEARYWERHPDEYAAMVAPKGR